MLPNVAIFFLLVDNRLNTFRLATKWANVHIILCLQGFYRGRDWSQRSELN